MTSPTPIQVSDARLREILAGDLSDERIAKFLNTLCLAIRSSGSKVVPNENSCEVIEEAARRLLLRSAQTSPAVEVVPAGFDVTDMAMIRRGDRIGPKLGARVADALVAASSSPPSVSSEPVAKPILTLAILSGRAEVVHYEDAAFDLPDGQHLLYATPAVTDEKEGESA